MRLRLAGSSSRLLYVLLLLGCGSKAAPTGAGSGAGTGPQGAAAAGDTTSFVAARDAFFDEAMRRSPDLAVGLGLHQHDGRVADLTATGIAAHVEWLRAELARFEGLAGAELDETAGLEREVILTPIRADLFDLDVMRKPFADPMFYPGKLELTPYVSRDYAPLADRARAITALSTAAAGVLATAQTNLPPAMPRTWIETALLQVEGMIDFAAKDVPAAMAKLDAEVAGALTASLKAYGAAFAGYRDFLRARLPAATDDFALGEARFLQMLADKEGVVIDLPRLAEIGDADLARNLAALERAARRIDPKKPIAAILEQAGRDKPLASAVLAEATRQAAAMRQLLIDKQIVSIPTDDVAQVVPSPPFMRWNFAFLNAPGPFDRQGLPAFYYISPPDPRWPKKEQEAYVPARSDLLFTTVHEVWPGHFLESLHTNRVPSRILKSFCSYSMGEGWAHYAEQMMLEAGAGGDDPRAALGQLSNALLRNVRFVSALGLHTRGMKVDESRALFEARGLQDRATARQQAVRGTFDPGYLNYTLGKLMIHKLRDDWKAKVGDRYSLKAFHDEFLSRGCAPIPLVRRAMLGPDAGPVL